MNEEFNKIDGLLRSNSAEDRRQGLALALDRQRTDCVPLITRIAGSDADPETRHLARKTLECLREKTGVNFVDLAVSAEADIQKLLDSDSAGNRASGLKKLLAEKSSTGHTMLLEALEIENDMQLKTSMISALGQFSNPDDVSLLVRFLQDEDARVRANTVEALAAIGNETALRCIIDIMPDEDNRIKANVIKALQGIGGQALFSVLKNMAEDKKHWVRASAVFAFSTIKTPQSMLMLAKMAQHDPDSSLRDSARNILRLERDDQNPMAKFLLTGIEGQTTELEAPFPLSEAATDAVNGNADISEVETLLLSDNPANRYIALSFLITGYEPPVSEAFMIAFSMEKDSFLLAMMLTVIRNASLLPAFNQVLEFLTHHDERVRANAVEAAIALDLPNTGKHLVLMLNDRSSRVVANSILGLHQLGFADLHVEVKKMLAQGLESFKYSAIHVASRVRDPMLLSSLEKLVRDSNPEVSDKAFAVLKSYAVSGISGAATLCSNFDRQIELEKSRSGFFKTSLDDTFAGFLNLIRVDSLTEETGREKADALCSEAHNLQRSALLKLAGKCRQENLLDDRSLELVNQIEVDIAGIDRIIGNDSNDCGSLATIDRAARQMSEKQLLNVEKMSLLARKNAVLSSFAMRLFIGRNSLTTDIAEKLHEELDLVSKATGRSTLSESFSMLPEKNAPVSEIFDITMRLYQKHVWQFSYETAIQFGKWALGLFIIGVGFGIFRTISMALASFYVLMTLPVFAWKSVSLLVEWKIVIATMVDDFIHGRDYSRERLQSNVEALHAELLKTSFKKYLMLSLWAFLAFFIAVIIIGAGNVSRERGILSSITVLVGMLSASFIFAGAFFNYLLVEPAAILAASKDPFLMAEKVYKTDRVKLIKLFIFASFVMTFVSATSVELFGLMTFLFPVLFSQTALKLLAFVSEVCLLPIIFSSITIYTLVEFEKNPPIRG